MIVDESTEPINPATAERYVVTLVVTGKDPRPTIIRLRGALKHLLRCFGLKCVTCTPSVEEDGE